MNRKILSFLLLVSFLLVVFTVPCLAATSSSGFRESNPPESDFAPQSSFIELHFGNGSSLYVAGNEFGYNNYFDTYDAFFDEAPVSKYQVLNYSDNSYWLNTTVFSGNVTWDTYFKDFSYATAELFVLNNLDPQIEGDYFAGFNAQTVPRWFQDPSQYQLPFYAFNTTSVYTNINAFITFEVYSVVNGEWVLTPYNYSGFINGVESTVGNRVGISGFVNERWEQFVRDSGYVDGPVRITHGIDVTPTNPQEISSNDSFGVYLIGDALAIDDSRVKLPVSNVTQSIDIFGWLSSSVDRFLSIEIFPDFTISTLLLMGLALPAFYAILKMLGGVG